MMTNPAFIGMPGPNQPPSPTVVAMEERNRASNAALVAAFVGKQEITESPPRRPTPEPIPGFAAAEAAETAGVAKVEKLKQRLAAAEAAHATATQQRAALVEKVASGEVLAPGTLSKVEDALRDAAAEADIIRQALPSVECKRDTATKAVEGVLYVEASRLVAAARARQTEAERAYEAALLARNAAGEETWKAEWFLNAGYKNQAAWGGRC